MSEHALIRRCAVCATDAGPFERHHIALRANSQTAAVWLCRPCHHKQTDYQRNAGLITREPIEGGNELSAVHALTEGLTGILKANALTLGDEQLARSSEHNRRVTLRLLAVMSDERPGRLGPRPISNDRRRGVGRRRQAPTLPAPSVADALHALAGIFPALALVISELLPGGAELLPGLTVDDLTRLLGSGRAARIARGLAVLESNPRARELAAIIERSRALESAFNEQLAGAAASDGLGKCGEIDTDGLVQLGRAFYDDARAYVDFAVALANGADPVAALERFLDQTTGRSDRARGRLGERTDA